MYPHRSPIYKKKKAQPNSVQQKMDSDKAGNVHLTFKSNACACSRNIQILSDVKGCSKIKNTDSFYCSNQKAFKIANPENCWKRENTHLITARKKTLLLLTTPHWSMKCYTYEQQYKKKKGNPIAFKKEPLLTILTQQIKAQLSQWQPLHSLQGSLYKHYISIHSFSHITSHKSTDLGTRSEFLGPRHFTWFSVSTNVNNI